MQHALGVLVALALLLPAVADAAEMKLRLRTTLTQDENAAGQDRGADQIIAIEPRVTIQSLPRQNLVWDFRYRPTYRYYVDFDERRGLDHQANGGFAWSLSKDTTLTGRVNGSRSFNVRKNREDDLDPIDDVLGAQEDVTFGDTYVNAASVNLAVSHRFNSAWSSSVAVNSNLRTFSGTTTRRDGWSYGLTAGMRRILSQRLSGGLSLSASRQVTEGDDVADDLGTNFYALSANVIYSFSPSMVLNASIGPSFIVPDDVAFNLPVTPATIGMNLTPALIVTPPTTVGGPAFLIDLPNGVHSRFPSRSLEEGVRLLDGTTCPEEGGVTFLSSQCEILDVVLGDIQRTALVGFSQRGYTLERPPSGTSTDSLTYFANISLTKRWKHIDFFMRYTRQDSGSLGGASTNIIDKVTARFRWKFDRDWTFTFGGSWSNRSQAADEQTTLVNVVASTLAGTGIVVPPFVVLVPENAAQVPAALLDGIRVGRFAFVDLENSTDITSYGFKFGATRRLGPRSEAFFRASWRQQTSESTNFNVNKDFDEFKFVIGVRYNFDPINL